MKYIAMTIISLFTLGTSISYADTSNTPWNTNGSMSNTTNSNIHSSSTTTNINGNPSGSTTVEPNTPTETTPPSPLTGNFDITTNYVYRGVSNSNNNPAFQGGLTYTFLSTGIYLNLWGSNVDFLDPQGNIATIEADTIAGITNSINDNWSYNISFDRYNYPKASAANYNEVVGAITYKIFTATISDSLNVYGSHSNGIYYNGLFQVPLAQSLVYISNLQAEASWGHYSLPRNAGLYSYSDVMVGLQKTMGQYVLLAQYTNTNHKSHNSGLDTGTLVLTLTANF